MRFLLLLPLCLTLLSAADKHPDFTGTWKMDAEHSDFGPVPKPANFVRKVEHQDPKLHVITTFSTPNGDMVTDVTHNTDGKESVNTVRGGEVKSTIVWEGASMNLTSKRMFNGAELTTSERWTVAGKVLTVLNKTTTPNGDISFTVVLNKQ